MGNKGKKREKTAKNPKGSGRYMKTLDDPDNLQAITELSALNMGVMDICRALGVGWDVWSLVVESTVHVNGLIDCPNGVSESLSRLEFLPFTVFCFIDFH